MIKLKINKFHKIIPTMKEMFKEGDKIKQKTYTTEEIIQMSHELRKIRQIRDKN